MRMKTLLTGSPVIPITIFGVPFWCFWTTTLPFVSKKRHCQEQTNNNDVFFSFYIKVTGVDEAGCSLSSLLPHDRYFSFRNRIILCLQWHLPRKESRQLNGILVKTKREHRVLISGFKKKMSAVLEEILVRSFLCWKDNAELFAKITFLGLVV